MKFRPAFEDACIPVKPQLHTSKHHHVYNGARSLPLFTWVRSSLMMPMTTRPSTTEAGQGRDRIIPERNRATPSSSSSAVIYEVKLYYAHNRACTVYRSWDDFARLSKGPTSSYNTMATPLCVERHVHGPCLHKFLREVLERWPHEASVEYFLRRRMGDCGGAGI
ncbi:hypothetical protein B0H66DRAFT_596928 [Apodospora peruviana]|uniref:Uncharacterized protein n=1 Tax=Apodospora peruviana TaxID=516989 RepID=A0AAE0IQS8_9PEZI|nr:hypothetical protein B0H66DRAFT_596928 [Apodospora peruviana]